MPKIIVNGPPVPWARARKDGKRHFNSARHSAHMRHIATLAQIEIGTLSKPDTASYFMLDAVFYVPDLRRRDVDNLGKLVADALTGVVWADDSQVWDMRAAKRLSRSEPRTVIAWQIIELPNGKGH